MKKLITVVLMLAACGDDKRAAGLPDGTSTPPVDAAADVPPDGPDVNPACVAPLGLPLAAGAQANAQAELTALAPTAELTWFDARDTLQSVNGLVVPLPGCTGTTNAFDLLFTTLAAHPALFQIDPAEWTGSVAHCSDILANGFTPLTIRRAKYGTYPIAHDVFTAVADVQNGVVILRNFSGTYLPKPSPAIEAALSACPDLTTDVIARHILSTPFVYQAYEPAPAPACTAEGDHQYSEQAGDTVTFDPTITIDWTEEPQVVFHRQGTATIVVGTANYTDQLVNSSVNCVDENGSSNIGWQRTYNSVTTEVLFDHATPDPFCTVCLR